MVFKVACVIVARNEEENIGETIKSLLKQTIDIKIVLVDDGSTDRTSDISKSLGVPTLSLPFHRGNYTGTSYLAIRFNVGLDYVRRYNPDFVLIMGGDHVLPTNYVESVIEQMEGLDGNIVVASGSITGQPAISPRGSGRLVNVWFWEKFNRMNYPIGPGWESWICFKALMEGYEIRIFEKPTSISRKTKTNPRKMKGRGRGMYVLGYHPLYVIARGFWIMFKRPLAGLAMLNGYFNHGNVQKLDTFDFLRKRQRKNLFPRIKEKLERLIFVVE